MSSSWSKVVAGARLVASAVVKLGGEDFVAAAGRATHHGLEVSSRAQQSLVVARQILWSQTVNGGGGGAATNGGGSQQLSASGMSPYESQLRKKQLYDQEPQQRASTGVSTENVLSESFLEGIQEHQPRMPNPYLLHEDPSISLFHDTSTGTDNQGTATSQPLSSSSSALEETRDASDAPISIDRMDHDTPRLSEGQAVPSSRLGRAAGFASLGAGLAWGTVAEIGNRLVGGGGSGSLVTNDRNADRLASTLCRMRGAALKMGQMLSIQDESLLPPALTRALNQVRQGAEAMPNHQLLQQLESQLGSKWRDKFESFEEQPFAAASIGQVHRATIRDDKNGLLKDVVVKVQYPGVASSIESDLRNLTMLVMMTGLAPKGLFIENVIRVGRDELNVECNYLNELANQQAMKDLVSSDPILVENRFVVPGVVEALTTEQILVGEYCRGGTIDKVAGLEQAERNRIGRTILYLTMKELFEWRLMQTDPNWGNFLYDVGSQQTTLIDFGSTREFAKEFVDGYLRIVWANANRDEDTLMILSKKMGFLTGEENDIMLEAHKMSGFTVGEPFWTDEPFDFRKSRISERMGQHTSVFLSHRLTPPPEEVYTLHRKLAGAYMLCIKIGAVVQCRDMLEDVVRNHIFGDGLPHPMT